MTETWAFWRNDGVEQFDDEGSMMWQYVIIDGHVKNDVSIWNKRKEGKY